VVEQYRPVPEGSFAVRQVFWASLRIRGTEKFDLATNGNPHLVAPWRNALWGLSRPSLILPHEENLKLRTILGVASPGISGTNVLFELPYRPQ